MDSEEKTERSHYFSVWKREGVKKRQRGGRESWPTHKKMQRQKRVKEGKRKRRKSRLDQYLI